MYNQQSMLLWRRLAWGVGILTGLVLVLALTIFARNAQAANAPSVITYQGKILENSLSVTTTKAMKFVLYDSVSGGSVKYTAAGTLGSPAAISVTPVNGIFTINLGGAGTNALDPNIFKDNTNIYLEVTVGSETLSPRKQLTAYPYAFNSLYASTSSYANNANFAESANNANTANTATFSNTAGTSTYTLNAGNANTATYANNAGLFDGLATSSFAKVFFNETISGIWNFINSVFINSATITSSTIATANVGNLHVVGNSVGLQLSDITGSSTLVYNNLSYSNPAWIASLSADKIIGTVTNSLYANFANTSTYANNANYSITANYANTAGTSSFAWLANTSSYAYNAGTSTYAGLSGTSTYSNNSDRLDGYHNSDFLASSTMALGVANRVAYYAADGRNIGYSNAVIISGAQVGINTTALDSNSALTISGNILAQNSNSAKFRWNDNGIMIKSGSSAKPSLDFNSGSNEFDFRIQETGTRGLEFLSGPSSTNQISRLKIDDNGHVGINNTSPSSTLDVTGDINLTGALKINNNDVSKYFITATGSAGYVLRMNASSTGYEWYQIPTAASGNGVAEGNVNYFSYYKQVNIGDTTSSVLVSSNDLYYDSTNGRIGIGNSAPGVKFDVTGAGKFSGDLTTNGNLAVTGGINSGSITSTGNFYGNNLNLASGGAIVIGGTKYSDYFIDSGVASGQFWVSNGVNSRGHWVTFAPVNYGSAGQLAYYSANGATVTGTSVIFINGSNVGVGTTTAASKLTVAGDINLTGNLLLNGKNYSQYFISSTGTEGYVWRANSTGYGYWSPATNGSGGSVATSTAGYVAIYSDIDGNISTAVTGTNALVVDNAGHVMIGTTTPYYASSTATTSTLTVKGALYADHIYTSGNSFYMNGEKIIGTNSTDLNFYADSGQNMKLQAVNGSLQLYTTGNGSVELRTDNNGDMRLLSANNLSVYSTGTMNIGTKNSSALNLFTTNNNLTITAGGTGNNLRLIGSNIYLTGQLYDAESSKGLAGQFLQTTATGTRWANPDGSGTVGSGSAGQVAYYNSTGSAITGSSAIFINSSTGYVGVGSTNPSSQFTVLSNASSGSIMAVGTTTNGNILNVLANGKVGIGTSSPQTTLEVNGSLSSKSYILNYQSGVSATDGEMALNRTNTNSYLNWLMYTNGVKYWAFGMRNVGTNDVYLWDDGASSNQEVLRITEGGANHNVIISNSNVGIGTTSPNYKLSVAGDVNASGTYYMNGKNYGQYFIDDPGTVNQVWTSNGSGRGQWLDVSALPIAGAVGTSTQGYLAYYDSDGANVTGTGAIFVSSTNGLVGVGTLNPNYRLHITGNDNSYTGPVITLSGNSQNQTESGRVRFTEDTTFAGAFIGYDGANNILNIGVHDSADTSVANDTKAISIKRLTGYVGIGTTTPAYPLTVSGNMNLTGNLYLNGTNYSQWFINSGTTTANLVWASDGTGTHGKWVNVNDIYTATTTGGTASAAGSIGQLQFNDGSNNLAATSALYWDNTNGRLGIGTSSPNYQLSLVNNATGLSANLILNNQTPTGYTQMMYMNNTGYRWTAGVGGASETNFTVPNKLYIYDANADKMRMVVDTSGNFGIGITNPIYKLDLGSGGDIRLANNSVLRWTGGSYITDNGGATTLSSSYGGGGGTLVLSSSNSTNTNLVLANNRTWEIYTAGSATGQHTGNFGIYDRGSSATRFRIDNSGRTLIGYDTTASTVSSTLTVLSNSNTDNLFQVGTTSAPVLFLINNHGNVGIGTTAPSYPLTVSGTAYISQDLHIAGNTYLSGGLYDSIGSVGTSGMILQSTGTSTKWTSVDSLNISSGSIGSSTIGNLAIYDTASTVTGTPVIKVNSNGYVTVGVTSTYPGSTAKLAISSVTTGVMPLSVYGVPFSSDYPVSMELLDSSAPAKDVGGGIAFGGNDGVTASRWWAMMKGGKENSISGNYSGYLSFSTRQTGVNGITERLRIASNGNVGIGTTTPSYPLTVSGTAYISQDLRVVGNTYLSGGLYDSTGSVGTSGMILQSTGTSTKWVTTSSLGIVDNIAAGLIGQLQFNDGSNNLAATSALYWDNTNGGLSVGYNITSTGAVIYNQSGESDLAMYANTGHNSKISFKEGGDDYFSLFYDGSVSSPNNKLILKTSSDAYGSLDKTALTVYQNGSVSMGSSDSFYWDNINSRLGIGTTSPNELLTLSNSGSAFIQVGSGVGANTVGVGSGIKLMENSFSQAAGMDLFYDGGTNQFSIRSYNNSNTPIERLTIARNSGNIGINSSTPNSQLAVVSINTNTIFSVFTSTTQPAISVANNGYVGVGTSSPSVALQVVGGIRQTFGVSDIKQVKNISVGSGPRFVTAFGDYLYVANYDANSVSIVDVSNPILPVVISTTTVGTQPRSIFVANQYLYVANKGSNNVSVIDISNPKLPIVVSTVSVGSGPRSVNVYGSYAYVANELANSITVIDVSNPASPQVISNLAVSAQPQDIKVYGSYGYVANTGNNSVTILNLSDPRFPKIVSTVSVGTGDGVIAISGRYAYTANYGSSNVSVIDITDPTSPVVVATVAVGSNPNSIIVSGRYAYTANYGSSNVSVIDITDPTSPVVVATVAVGSNPNSIIVSGRYAYTANYGSSNVSVIDMSGSELSSLTANSANFGYLQSSQDIVAQGSVNIGTSLKVNDGIFSNGSITVVDKNSFSYFGGKLGIGISSSSYPLTVSGTAYISQDLRIAGNAYLSGGLYDSTGSVGTSGMILQSTGTSTKWVPTSTLGISGGTASAAGSSGWLQFNDGSNNLAATSALYWDNTNGRLGIGTSSPANLLNLFSKNTNNIYNELQSNTISDRPGLLLKHSGSNGAETVNGSRLGVLGFMGSNGNSDFAGSMIDSYTNTSVSGNSAASDLRFSTNPGNSLALERMRINSNGNVGIGTTVPTSTLSVLAATSTGNIFQVGTTTNQNILMVGANGNVGIGTSTPASLLSLYAATNPQIFISDSGSTGGILITTDTAINSEEVMRFGFSLDQGTARNFAFRANGTNLLTVRGNGRVGVGTSTPAGKFSVYNSIDEDATVRIDANRTVSGSNSIMEVYNNGILRTRLNATGIQNWNLNNGSSEVGVISYTTPSGYPAIDISSSTAGRIGLLFNTTQGYLQLYATTTPSGTYPASDPKFVLTANGNVGIGTSSPNYPLTINYNTSGYALGVNVKNSLSTGYTQYGVENDGGQKYSFGVGGSAETSFPVPNKFYIFDANSNTMRMVIDKNGNVGIGTTTPSFLLSMSKTAQSSTRETMFSAKISDSANAMIGIGNGTAGDSYFQPAFYGFAEYQDRPSVQLIGYTTSANDVGGINSSLVDIRGQVTNSVTDPNNGTLTVVSNRDILNVGSGGNTYLRLKANGNFGIGTAAPTSTLSVLAATSTGNIFQVGTTTNQNILTVTAGGYVGIGTITPQANLDIEGTGSARTLIRTTDSGTSGLAGFKLLNDNGVSYEALSYGSGNTNGTWFGLNSKNTTFNLSYGTNNAGYGLGTLVNSPVSIGTNNVSRIYITGSGNVGIGTTSPAYPLTVSGTPQFTGLANSNYYVCVDSSGALYSSSAACSGSDERLKTNITSMSSVLSKVMNLKPVSYNWKTGDSGTEVGFIAQDMEQYFPELVAPAFGDYLGIKYDKLTAVLTKAIQEQQTEIENFQSLNTNLVMSSSTTSTDLTVAGNLKVIKDVEIKGHVYFSDDSIGQAKILAGAVATHISFEEDYAKPPIVTISPLDFVGAEYRVGTTTVSGFDIELSTTSIHDVSFNWHAFSTNKLKVHMSDGQVVIVYDNDNKLTGATTTSTLPSYVNPNNTDPSWGPVGGCTNPLADNYNPNATDDDGSCVINNNSVSATTNTTVSNIDSTATIESTTVSADTVSSTQG